MLRSRSSWSAIACAVALLVTSPVAQTVEPAPIARNVVVIMTDDQGLGDFGFQGHPVLRTPNLDQLAAQAARLERFYVHPVCAPTRAALMTGRWPQRTSAIDTWIGRAMMNPEETTVAEILHDAGFATGIFGKWHLGDCAPMRPQDRGFDEVLVHRGGGIGQPSDPAGFEAKYTDAGLFHNGEQLATEGYCTDVYFTAGMEWIRGRHEAGQRFFCYLPTNAPHGPFGDVPAAELEYYRSQDLTVEKTEDGPGWPVRDLPKPDRLARIYAMIDNVDQNVGRLLAMLDELQIADDTLVLFLVDNGPNTRRYLLGHRGHKSSVYEGGIRSPLLARWPAGLRPGVFHTGPGANVDLLPTILAATAVPLPDDLRIDGRSLLGALRGDGASLPADRALVVQIHRGDRPLRAHHAALITRRWKLVNHSGFRELEEAPVPQWELFDLLADPYEQSDVAAEHAGVVADLARRYDAWFEDVTQPLPDGTDRYAPQRIWLGSDAEPAVTLTRQDWRRIGDRGGWSKRDRGVWYVDVRREGDYRLVVRAPGGTRPSAARLRCAGVDVILEVPADAAASFVIEAVRLPQGPAVVDLELRDGDGSFGAWQVDVLPVD